MPIEIRELIIRAYIESSNQENQDNITEDGLSAHGNSIKLETIDEIVDLIKNKNER